MKNSFFMMALLLTVISSWAQVKTSSQLSEGAQLLFNNTKSKLSNAEKNWLFKQLDCSLSKDKQQFMFDEYEVEVKPYITEMNKDGKEEVFIVMKSGALFGNTGESFFLFIKNKAGKFERQQDLGGGMIMILTSKKEGYPEIAIGGPGFEFPVYHWDGKKYSYSRKLKDADLQTYKVKYLDIAEYSKSYADSIKP